MNLNFFQAPLLVSPFPHQVKNTKIYFDQREFIEKEIPNSINFMEIGTLGGDYAEIILKTKSPKHIHLIDTFNSSDIPEKNRFNQKEHFNYVKNKFIDEEKVVLTKGRSQEVVPSIETFYDYIYIDASHENYFDVVQDIQNSIKRLKPNGIIGFNDYTKYDKGGQEYFVYEAVNQFLYCNQDWEIISLTLLKGCYHDIHIRKIKNL